jgi:hypothetical protein
VPRVHHAVVTKSYREACGQLHGHVNQAAALRVGFVAALQGDVDKGVGDHAQLRFGHHRQYFAHMVVAQAMLRIVYPCLGSLRAKYTITGIAQARQYVAMVVELAVDGGGVNRHVGVGFLHGGHAFWAAH